MRMKDIVLLLEIPRIVDEDIWEPVFFFTKWLQ